MKKKKLKEGFTLVEVLIVLGIIAVLTSIAVPSVKGIINQANATKIVTDMQNVQVAVLNYSLYNNNLSGLTIETLISDGYLSSSFNYKENENEIISLADGGINQIKILYTGDSPSALELKKINNNLTIENNNAYLLVKF
ncbi:type II secretion system protein [Petrotoga sp. 9PW.55.5.1]|uniref:type II secretion system protein n=1 Tax=Petrotoga sp. 9PW.55.5.1 TaxID=1308979 RepID=UPI000DD5C7F0|nr:type II secretion system protein [Petrotoga sp. 9PW.55.5.1]